MIKHITILAGMAAFVIASVPAAAETTVRDHRTPASSNVRDHRAPAGSNVRDHRKTAPRPAQGSGTSHAVSFDDANRIMKPYRQWMIGANGSGSVMPNTPAKNRTDHRADKAVYNLKGSAIRKFLHYEKQGAGRGINLGWTDNASARTAVDRAHWRFSRQLKSRGPVRYGESIAIAWGNGDKPFIKYGHRKVGINLHWSRTPVYEWTILGGRPGQAIKRGEDWVVIYNLKLPI